MRPLHVLLFVFALPFLTPSRAWAVGGNDTCKERDADADDIRDTYDTRGRLVRQLRVKGGAIVEEITIAYDPSSGLPTERRETAGGSTRVAAMTYDGDKIVEASCFEGGRFVAVTGYTYDGDKLVSKQEDVEGELRRTTLFTYDAGGEVVAAEARTSDGALVSRTVSDRPEPRPPLEVKLLGGGSYQSDTQLVDATVGLGVHRSPRPRGGDLELSLDGSYKFNRAKGVTAADQLRSRLGVDYVHPFPRTSFFTFVVAERNLPANLDMNLELALVGLKFDVLAAAPFKLDASFVPVWNFRAISTPLPAAAGAPTTIVESSTSTLRGSLRVRAGYKTARFGLSDTVEFLPVLTGDTPPGTDGIWDQSIFRNTAVLAVDLSKRFTLQQEVRYTRDLAMRAQAATTCPNDAEPLCLGYAVATLTALTVNLEVGEP